MMTLSKNMRLWLWKWHLLAGLITLPIVLLLCVTGILYLFKDNYNHFIHQQIFTVPAGQNQTPISTQLKAVEDWSGRTVDKITLSPDAHKANAFVLAGKGRARVQVYVNQYTGEVTGEFKRTGSLMYKIRKLHGELLLSKPGTYVIELVASWFIVLLITGLCVFWPAKEQGFKNLITIRTNKGKRAFYRDTHNVVGFWLSIFMLVIIAGGMPWTDIFGANLKWVQKQTNTGYPMHWRSNKKLSSTINGQPMTIDQMIESARSLNLPGTLTVDIPNGPNQVISVSNRSLWLRDQQVVHLDQYSGQILVQLNWQQVGLLMEMRQVAMRLHQGEYGLISWFGVMLVALVFTLSTIAGLVSYLIRKPKGQWGMINVPKSFRPGFGVVVAIVILGLLFPLFGLSLVIIALLSLSSRWLNKSKTTPVESQR